MLSKAPRQVIVSGGAGAIGGAVVAAFVASGGRVAILDHPDAVQKWQASAGDSASAFAVDVTDPAAVERAIAVAVDWLEGLDTLVCCAGITARSAAVETDLNTWNALVHVNLSGTYFMCKYAVPHMPDSGGAIVNISSIRAELPAPGAVPYAATKGAVMQLTKGLAIELAPHGIRVNAVGPGAIGTQINEAKFSDEGYKQSYLAGVPLGRLGRPEEIAAAVEFLASDDASYITGTTLYVDGGFLAGKWPS
jgi:NAD(P)-dependent dehydrogenase (short-subunit alcohol dehydrogenase family)